MAESNAPPKAYEVLCKIGGDSTDHGRLAQAAVVSKFIAKLFKNTFAIMSRHVVEIENCRKQNVTGFNIGVVSFADGQSFSNDLPRRVAKWTNADGISIVVGHWGKRNEKGIKQTAVAAGATVGFNICT